MTTRIIFLLTLLAYSIIVSQSFMYILSLRQVQLSLDADPYTALRKLTDTGMRGNFKYVVYAALLTSLALVIVNIKNPGGLVFITAAIAFAALVIDTVLTLKGNLPINDVINTWSAGNIPSNWTEYRTKWFEIFQYRQIATITGFVSLLVGVVWKQ
jgi:hypothetical protein